MAFEDVCNTVLSLGSASNNLQTHNHQQNMIKSVSMKVEHSIPSLALGLSIHGESYTVLNREAFNSVNLVSSYSNSSVKRERSKDVSEEEVEIERVSFKELSDDQVDEEGMSARKKLRLTKQQSLILEDRFKEHSTLNPKQKQALAKQLNLRPRQVEVWFQNRRARTKLKQTEVECELLKKHWETLTVENKRLQKELQELKVTTTPFYMQYSPAATHTLCPSCQRIDGSGQKYNSNPKSGFSFEANKPHFYNPFTNPSATC